MTKRIVRLACFWCVCTLILTSAGCTGRRQSTIRPSRSLPSTTPWDLEALSDAPSYVWIDQSGPVWSLFYEGEPYKGRPTSVFAYYASPATVNAESVPGTTYPAVVLVHGGGGTAFKGWASLWAKRGYAAIAMDLAGCGAERQRLVDGGPDQSDDTKFGAIDQPIGDQWTYHAVANVILAHSFIRSSEEIDAERTAVTGISWGGYLTSIVAGLDSRFKAAVPVYGCGFLHENSVWLDRFAKMTPEQKDRWATLWDPSQYVGSAQMPVFFVNGTNDFAYPLDSYAKTYGLVEQDRNLRITVNMPHGHQQGWAPEEIGLFIDQHVKGGVPLASVGAPKVVDGTAQARVESDTDLVSAELHYTTGTTPINKLDWQTIPAMIDSGQTVSTPLPDEATLWFVTVTDSRGAVVSSELVFSEEAPVGF